MLEEAKKKVQKVHESQEKVQEARPTFAKRSKPFPKHKPTPSNLSAASSTSPSKKRSFSHVISDDSDDDQPLRVTSKAFNLSSNLLKLPQPPYTSKQASSTSQQSSATSQKASASFSQASATLQQPSATLQQPSATSGQPSQPQMLTRRRPLPQVTSQPWFQGEMELRECIWEAFVRIRRIHSSITEPQLRDILLHFDLELEEVLNLMGPPSKPQ